ncbi:MAG: hypothetical protein EBQ95_04140 [Gammaproteobacteria bacterium]|nr:hypothetical protein [Gammaproteobacteria bacterium]
MKKVITVVLLMSCFANSFAYPFQKRCKAPKTHVVCQRQCFYNYYGPGAHCDEKCLKTEYTPTPPGTCAT